MNGSGCKTCAVYPNCVAEYRGSTCKAIRGEFGLGDPKTNADHIRSMTDEELAEFLCDATYKENEQGYPIMRTVNKVRWRKWLKQPYGGE